MSRLEMTKPVGFRTRVFLWNKFKAKCYEEGHDVSTVLTTMIRLFIEDDEFRARVLNELSLNGG